MLLWARLLPALFILTSCGYSLNLGIKETFNAKGKGIFVPMFTNNTDEVGAEVPFTNALIRELESHGEKTVSKREGAGLEIRGSLVGYSQNVEAFQNYGTRGERQQAPLHDYARMPDGIGIRMSVRIDVVDPADNSIRWSTVLSPYGRVAAPISRVSDWDAPSSVGLFTQSLIEASYPELARDMMRDLWDQMVDL